jgi:MFS family permease
MVCAGAAEQAIAQWVSTFAESGLRVSKTVGDLAGPCAFAACMGAARALYGKFSEKLPLKSAMIACAALCIACYLTAAFAQSAVFALVGCALCGFSVGIFWPGTFSAAAVRLPTGGIAMYALMALAGDLGCSAGPTLVGLIASANGNSLSAGLAVAIIFPIVILLGISLLKIDKKKE